MPAASETFVALEHQLAERRLAFERLDEAWPHGRNALDRAAMGRRREILDPPQSFGRKLLRPAGYGTSAGARYIIPKVLINDS